MNYSTKKKRSKKQRKWAVLALLVLLIIYGGLVWYVLPNKGTLPTIENFETVKRIIPQLTSPTPTPMSLPMSKTLSTDYHIFQSFNNCGPAALSMALRFYGIDVSQQELGNALRPYQVPGGDNDDKSVTLKELGEKGKDYGLTPYHRPMGNPDIIKKFIANDIPVITRTWTKPNEDIGHFRVVKGYNDNTQTVIQDDSLQGHDLPYSYSDFNELWKKFNYEYVVLVPSDKIELAEQILGENKDETTAWKNAVKNSEEELRLNPNDIDARFNLSVALYNTGNYEGSIREFEKVESALPFRTLWYQIEPIEAYFQVGNYDKVLQITQKTLDNENKAFSELYDLRGKVYTARNELDLAEAEFEKAHLYNTSKF